jgi:hypothetical protein
MTTTGVCLPTGVSATTRGRSRIFLDVLAVELDDHVARLDAGGLGRPLSSTPATSAPRGGLIFRLRRSRR